MRPTFFFLGGLVSEGTFGEERDSIGWLYFWYWPFRIRTWKGGLGLGPDGLLRHEGFTQSGPCFLGDSLRTKKSWPGLNFQQGGAMEEDVANSY